MKNVTKVLAWIRGDGGEIIDQTGFWLVDDGIFNLGSRLSGIFRQCSSLKVVEENMDGSNEK